MEREAGFFEQLAEDGRPALMLFAVGLLISGAFAGFLTARRGHAGASSDLPRRPYPLASSGDRLDTGMAEDGGGPCRTLVASARTLGLDRDGTGDDGRRSGDPLPGHDRRVRRRGSRLHG